MRSLVISAALAAGLFACSRAENPIELAPTTLDLCANLEDDQLSIPTGVMQDEDGNCDLCINVDGFQLTSDSYARNPDTWICAPPPPSPAPQPPTLPAPPRPVPRSYVLAGAGDIAVCGSRGAEETARILDSMPALFVFTLGDNVYPYASRSNFMNCYEPNWGRHKHHTRPSVGNHDNAEGAPPQEGLNAYFWYFPNSGAPNGWYSYDIGEDWHAIALNSEDSSGAQIGWLRTDIQRNRGKRIFAYWHRPLFSNGPNSGEPKFVQQSFWNELYGNACIVGNGHEHFYYRYPKLNPAGAPDANGIREFISGTGGGTLYDPGASGTGERGVRSWGILKLTLYSNAEADYEWEFITPGGVRDAGRDRCPR